MGSISSPQCGHVCDLSMYRSPSCRLIFPSSVAYFSWWRLLSRVPRTACLAMTTSTISLRESREERGPAISKGQENWIVLAPLSTKPAVFSKEPPRGMMSKDSLPVITVIRSLPAGFHFYGAALAY